MEHVSGVVQRVMDLNYLGDVVPVIRKGVPLPAQTLARWRFYPFEAMEVGDNFILSCIPQSSDLQRQSYVIDCRRLANQASKHGLENGKRFACRFVPGGLMGCWRTK